MVLYGYVVGAVALHHKSYSVDPVLVCMVFPKNFASHKLADLHVIVDKTAFSLCFLFRFSMLAV